MCYCFFTLFSFRRKFIIHRENSQVCILCKLLNRGENVEKKTNFFFSKTTIQKPFQKSAPSKKKKMERNEEHGRKSNKTLYDLPIMNYYRWVCDREIERSSFIIAFVGMYQHSSVKTAIKYHNNNNNGLQEKGIRNK